MDKTWIKTYASILVDGFGEPAMKDIAPFRMKPEMREAITTMAGIGENLWWRHDDIRRSADDAVWGWCFKTGNDDRYYQMRYSKLDWEIDLWFKDPNAAMLVKLALPIPTSV